MKRKGEDDWTHDLTDEYKKPKSGWEYQGVFPSPGRYWAYSKANMLAFADVIYLLANEFAGFQNTQQSRLCSQWQFTDLIQKNSTSIRLFKFSDLFIQSTGK